QAFPREAHCHPHYLIHSSLRCSPAQMALQAATSFLPSALSARKEGAAKDSAFFRVCLADGLKFDTTSLGLRTKV
uniref:Uncharacterized protein n=1 Tax=Aegilops tauschii subsp. strangulata TaxID=200361 RepID=A0A452YKI9_AEGTS